MSEVIGFVGISHSPFATLLAPPGPGDPGAEFLAAAARVAKAVTDLAPDAVVVIGPDHFHANFYDVMPPFIVGVESAVGFGDFGSTSGPLPVDAELGWLVHDGLCEAGFDPALSYALTVDHGVVQGYEMATGDTGVPLVPIVLNTAAPPLPSLGRCRDLGRALGDVLRAAPYDGRVLVVASGGLSHWLPSNDPRDPSVVGERRDALIHGRADAAFAAAREPRVKAMGGNPRARVNREWDRWFLDACSPATSSPSWRWGTTGSRRSPAAAVTRSAAGWSATRPSVSRCAWTSYEPVPEWIAGMGIGTTFPVAS